MPFEWKKSEDPEDHGPAWETWHYVNEDGFVMNNRSISTDPNVWNNAEQNRIMYDEYNRTMRCDDCKGTNIEPKTERHWSLRGGPSVFGGKVNNAWFCRRCETTTYGVSHKGPSKGKWPDGRIGIIA
jgi:hypothetical protein